MKRFPSGEKGMGALAGCKVRSGKPGRFERKKGTKGAAFRRRAGVNREQTGTWDAKKGPFTVRLRSGGCGERKKEEPWGTASGSAPVRAQGRERNAVSVLGEKIERGCSDEGGEKEGAFGKIRAVQERNRNFAGLRG